MRHSGGKDASGCAWGSAAAARLLAIDILFVIRPPISNNNKLVSLPAQLLVFVRCG